MRRNSIACKKMMTMAIIPRKKMMTIAIIPCKKMIVTANIPCKKMINVNILAKIWGILIGKIINMIYNRLW